MVPTEKTLKYFGTIPHRVRSAFAGTNSPVGFEYDEEPFFKRYEALRRIWTKRESQRSVAEWCNTGRQTIKKMGKGLCRIRGPWGFSPIFRLSKSICGSKSSPFSSKKRVPTNGPTAYCGWPKLYTYPEPVSIRFEPLKRSRGYGQRMGADDIEYFKGLQHIFESVSKTKGARPLFNARPRNRPKTFFKFRQGPPSAENRADESDFAKRRKTPDSSDSQAVRRRPQSVSTF